MTSRSGAYDRLCVVLVSTRNPLNIGAVARAMGNFGVRHLRVVEPYDRAFREAKSAVGASGLLKNAEEYSSLEEAVADRSVVIGTTAARARELHHPLRPLKEAMVRVRRALPRDRIALVFGPEKHGLSNADLSHCHWLLRIPTREEQPSMNLGQAVAMCLYELVRTSQRAATTKRERQATAGELERVTSLLFDALETSGYLKGQATAPSQEKLRRLVRRLDLTSRDAQVWLGMFRQMLWKMRTKPKGNAN